MADMKIKLGREKVAYLKKELEGIRQQYPSISKLKSGNSNFDEFTIKFKSFLAAGKLLLQPIDDKVTPAKSN